MKTSELKLEFTSNPKNEDIDILTRGITEYAKEQRGLGPPEPFAYFLRNSSHEIIAGCNGVIFYECMYIDQLWVHASYRNQKLGTLLIKQAEQYAKEQNCALITLNTMDWEALGFYEKLGYKLDFVRSGLKNNSKLYHLRKQPV